MFWTLFIFGPGPKNVQDGSERNIKDLDLENEMIEYQNEWKNCVPTSRIGLLVH